MSVYEILPEFVQDSPEWHDARTNGIGASEVAAILGLSPHMTPLSVYRAKMGVRNEIPEDLAYFGHKLEPIIRNWITDKHPEVGPIGDGVGARSTVWPWLTASPDGLGWGEGGRIPVEYKTSSAYSKDSWADGVPLHYAAQVQTQIAVLGAPYGWLAVLHGGNTPELYRIERDDDFILNHLIPKTKAFRDDHVLTQTPPEPTTSAEAIELWPGTPELSVEGGEDLYELWGAYGLMQAEIIDAQETLDGIKLQLQIAMADATELTHDGQTLFTWKPRAGAKRLDTTALKDAHPLIVAEFTRAGEPTRTFLRKKADNT